jgi:hypothetical protein
MKHNQITFFSAVPGIAETFPIRHAKDVLPSWLQTARLEHLKGDKRDQTVVRCPGIVDILTTGYIISTWHDFDINIDRDGKVYFLAPDERITKMLVDKDSLQMQNGDGMAKYLPKRPWSHPNILKINTPWNIVAPKGLKFLMIPLPYSEFLDFESNTGILDPGYSTELNVQGYLNLGPGNHSFKAGTPIAQIIPLSNENYKMVVRDMNEEDKKWYSKRSWLNLFSFVYHRTKVKEAYERHVDESTKKCPFHFWKK